MKDRVYYNVECKGYVDTEDGKVFCIRSAARSKEALEARRIAEKLALTNDLILVSRVVEENTDFDQGFAVKEWYA